MLRRKIKYHRDDILFTVLLLFLSAVFYIVHLFIFDDLHHIMIFGMSDLAFLPIEVILVSLILHRVVTANEKKRRMGKVYMVIEVFFTGLGFDMLKIFASSDSNIEQVEDTFVMDKNWKMRTMKKNMLSYIPDLNLTSKEYTTLQDTISYKSEKIERLIENPMLIEHDTFSDLLMAIYHFYKELVGISDFNKLSKNEEIKLKKDAERVYLLLCIEWIEYLNHTKTHYPYFL